MKEKLKSCFEYLKECGGFMFFYLLFIFWIFFRDVINLEQLDFALSFSYIFTLPFFGIVIIFHQISELRKKDVTLKKELSILFKEIVNYLLFWVIFNIITEWWQTVILSGNTSVNQSNVEKAMLANPIVEILLAVLLAPIVEEFLFRFFPRQFIKNNIAYIIISGFVFAFVHCISTPNALLYLPMYLPDAIYLGYIYTKTDDILVPMTIHGITNLIASILILITA